MAGRRYCLVLSTAPPGHAGALAEKIIAAHLAACVNVLSGISSHYFWKGEKEKSREHLLMAKTTSAKVAELTRFIEENHPYETPEIVALPFSRGSKAYLRWISECVR